MRQRLVIWSSIFGASGVMLGALGAHALKNALSDDLLLSFETGVRYQVLHAIVLLILGFQSHINTKWIANLMIIGIVLFSGSIYLLSIRELIGMESLRLLGPITPVGGLMLITSWLLILKEAFNYKTKN